MDDGSGGTGETGDSKALRIFPFFCLLILAFCTAAGAAQVNAEWYERIKKMTLVRNLQRQQFVKCPSRCICYQEDQGVAPVTRCMFLRLRKIPSPDAIDGKTQRL